MYTFLFQFSRSWSNIPTLQFYTIDNYSQTVQYFFLINPIYLYSRYFRKIVIESTIPTPQFHLLAAAYALIAFGAGAWMYKRYNHEFLYYV